MNPLENPLLSPLVLRGLALSDRDDAQSPRYAELCRVLACSDFAARVLQDSRQREALLKTSALPDYTTAIPAELATVQTAEGAFAKVLRQIRQREMVRLLWQDLHGAPLNTILHGLSTLAAVLTQQAVLFVEAQLATRFGQPKTRPCFLAMGKLGGDELNFSSDIDLIPIYGTSGQVGRLDHSEFFRRLVQSVGTLLSEVKAEGFVYRVDFRLRPFGAAGPLAITAEALVDYYQTHGRDWERYALIKARPIAGDEVMGDQILRELQPFIYRRYLDYGAIEALRDMKTMIQQEVKRKSMEDDLKKGPGGIREIEFIVQTFQMIYGGRDPLLRRRELRPTLYALGQSGRLSAPQVTALDEAYVFLRQTENRLQAIDDQQTHRLPKDPVTRARLAYAMNYADWPTFFEQLQTQRHRVADIFEGLFALAPKVDRWLRLWQDESPKAFEKAGFTPGDTALQQLDALKNSRSVKLLGPKGRQRLDRFMPLLLQEISHTTKTPPLTTLTRVLPLIESVARRSVYLALMAERVLVRQRVVKLAEASPWLAQYVARHPISLDELLGELLSEPPRREDYAAELQRQIPSSADLETVMDALRQFKQGQLLRIAAADRLNQLPLMRVSDALTYLAEAIVAWALDYACHETTLHHGTFASWEDNGPPLMIVAYGKLGGYELGYGSDLDIVFLHDSLPSGDSTGPRPLDAQSWLTKVVRRFNHLLTTATPAGVLYDVDMRLRPSGRAGLLLTSLAAFTRYQMQYAWTWEHQALVRARPVAGATALGDQFREIRRQVLQKQRERALLRSEVAEMRAKMRTHLGQTDEHQFHLKQDKGGIADIEFIVQFLVLANGHTYPTLLQWSDNIRQLDSLMETGILAKQDGEALQKAYVVLREQQHEQVLQEQGSEVAWDTASDAVKWARQTVQHLWQTLLAPEPTAL